MSGGPVRGLWARLVALRFRPLPLQTALLVTNLLMFMLPVLALVGSRALSEDLVRTRQEELSRQSGVLALWLAAEMAHEAEEVGQPGDATARDALLRRTVAPLGPTLKETQRLTGAGVRILDMDGVVIATTGPRLGEDLSDREEVQDALTGVGGIAARRGSPPPAAGDVPLLRRSLPVTNAFAAVPLSYQGERVGVVLMLRATRAAPGAVKQLVLGVGPFALVLGGLVGSLAVWFAWRLSRSLRRLTEATPLLADGRIETLGEVRETRVLEVRELARRFEEVTTRLRAQVGWHRDFAANVAHEFKTPITTLRGTIELLAEEGDLPLPPEQRAIFLENARTDLDRLERMVQGLLELARAEAAVPRQRVELGPFLAGLKLPAERRGEAGVVRGDPRLLELAVRNLVENAHTHGASPVVVELWREPPWTGFTVVDAGPGINPGNLPRLFERFFTTSADRRGTGLGLPLVRAIAQAHGGEVEVTSVPGRTAFRVALPEGE